MLSTPHDVPWETGKRQKIRVKRELYFHTKDDMWNSQSHTSRKVEEFYLAQHQAPPFLGSRPHSSLPNPVVTDRTLVSQDRLLRRTLERELLQVKSSQRVIVGVEEDRQEVDLTARFRDYRNTAKKGTTDGENAWNRLNDLPVNRAKLMITETAIKRDEAAVDAISTAFSREMQQQAKKASWLQQNRKLLQSKLSKRHAQIAAQEGKAGIQKRGLNFSQPLSPPTAHILRLAQPHLPAHTQLSSDYSGLLLVDFGQAAEAAQGVKSRLSSARTLPSNTNFFPLPERLGTASSAVLDSRPQSRPFTVRGQRPSAAWKDQDPVMTSEEVRESMQAIHDFDHRFGKELPTTFSKVHFAPKQPVSTSQTS